MPNWGLFGGFARFCTIWAMERQLVQNKGFPLTLSSIYVQRCAWTTASSRQPTWGKVSTLSVSCCRYKIHPVLCRIAQPHGRTQPHHVGSCTPLGPKKQARMPAWLVRSIWSSTGPMRPNLVYLVKTAIFALSMGPRAGF